MGILSRVINKRDVELDIDILPALVQSRCIIFFLQEKKGRLILAFYSGLHGSEIRYYIIVGIIIVRYIALPLMGIAVVKGAIHFGLVHSDPLYQFILLLQFAVPPAMNIGMLHTLL